MAASNRTTVADTTETKDPILEVEMPGKFSLFCTKAWMYAKPALKYLGMAAVVGAAAGGGYQVGVERTRRQAVAK